MEKLTKNILIAEDSYQWQKCHESLLNQYDKYNISYTLKDSAREALWELESDKDKKYDLIITDLQMESDFLPDFAGEWFIKQIKNNIKYQNTNIVIVSATYNIGFISNVLGVNYLSKRSLVSNPDSYFMMLDENL